jgi:hypothetical protein
MLVFLMSFAIVGLAEASPSPTSTPTPEVKEVEIGSVKLTYTTNLNMEETRSLKFFQSGTVRLNGIKLSQVRRLAAQSFFTQIFKPPREKIEFSCAAGSYTYLRKIGKKSVRVEGCMESDEFSRISRAFRRI